MREFLHCAHELGSSPKSKWSIFWSETKNLRVRLKLATYRPQEIYALNTVYGVLWLRDNFGDITNLPDIFAQNVYRMKRLEHPGVILDVGANIGLAAARFAISNPDRQIYCFEPVPACAALIKRNCPTAIVNEVAVGASSGRVTLRLDPDNVIASCIPCRWETTDVEFEVVSLDEVSDREGIEEVAFLKIDVEGMEIDVLEGARRTLERTWQIAMETHGRSQHEKVITFLEALLFHVDAQSFDGATGFVFASHDKLNGHLH